MVLALGPLTALLPVISLRRFQISPLARIWRIVMLCVQAVILVVGLAMLISAAGYDLVPTTVAMLAVGVMLLLIGNVMGKLRKNFFIGIRTAWSSSKNAVWERTHRIGGRWFMLAGMVVLIATLSRMPIWVPVAATVVVGLVPTGDSLVIFSLHLRNDWIFNVSIRQAR